MAYRRRPPKKVDVGSALKDVFGTLDVDGDSSDEDGKLNALINKSKDGDGALKEKKTPAFNTPKDAIAKRLDVRVANVGMRVKSPWYKSGSLWPATIEAVSYNLDVATSAQLEKLCSALNSKTDTPTEKPAEKTSTPSEKWPRRSISGQHRTRTSGEVPPQATSELPANLLLHQMPLPELASLLCIAGLKVTVKYASDESLGKNMEFQALNLPEPYIPKGSKVPEATLNVIFPTKELIEEVKTAEEKKRTDAATPPQTPKKEERSSEGPPPSSSETTPVVTDEMKEKRRRKAERLKREQGDANPRGDSALKKMMSLGESDSEGEARPVTARKPSTEKGLDPPIMPPSPKIVEEAVAPLVEEAPMPLSLSPPIVQHSQGDPCGPGIRLPRLQGHSPDRPSSRSGSRGVDHSVFESVDGSRPKETHEERELRERIIRDLGGIPLAGGGPSGNAELTVERRPQLFTVAKPLTMARQGASRSTSVETSQSPFRSAVPANAGWKNSIATRPVSRKPSSSVRSSSARSYGRSPSAQSGGSQVQQVAIITLRSSTTEGITVRRSQTPQPVPFRSTDPSPQPYHHDAWRQGPPQDRRRLVLTESAKQRQGNTFVDPKNAVGQTLRQSPLYDHSHPRLKNSVPHARSGSMREFRPPSPGPYSMSRRQAPNPLVPGSGEIVSANRPQIGAYTYTRFV